jgi:phage terminase large subunit
MSNFWKNPDYTQVIAERIRRLERLRENPEQLAGLRAYYATDIASFISDFGTTSDPRQRNKGLPSEMPFVLFDRQRESIEFIQECMRGRRPGLIEKSRDCGMSWLAMCFAVSLCLFHKGVVVGVGSRTEDKVDRTGDPDSLLWKARFFLKNLPPEFRGNWDETRHSAHMRIQFPDTGSSIVAEAGDSIGRGGRSTLYIIDEAAFIPRPQLIEASLASNTETRIDISTPNGRANSFATKRWSGRVPTFTFRWTEDPRKDSDWYARQCEVLDPVTLAAEVDLNYDASTEGQLLPIEWIYAAVDAHVRLGIEPTGARRGALDVADEGKDRNAFAARRGILLEHLKSWSGKGSNIYATTVKAFALCEEYGCDAFDFDSDGLGAGVRGDSVDINGKRRDVGKPEIAAEPFRGSGGVFDPEGSLVEGRQNKNYFQNLKAQAWWSLRLRFQATHRAVVDGLPYDPDQIISLSSALGELATLQSELVQPVYSINSVGKIVIEKTPDGAMSPNLADALVIAYSPLRAGAYFAAPPVPTAAEKFKIYDLPKRMDHTFAVVSFLDDSAAVVYCAANNLRAKRGPPFHILDYDLIELGPDTEKWVRGIVSRLDDLFAITSEICANGFPFGDKQLFSDDPAGTYREFLRQRGIPMISLDTDIRKRDVLPPVAERFAKAKPYVNLGAVVIDRQAHEREVTFRGSKRNFLRELLSQTEIPQTNPLAQAFSSAILVVFKGDPAVAVSQAELQAMGLFGIA